MAGGQDVLKGKILRLGHMGYVDQFDVLSAISGLELVLLEMGYPVENGAGVAAAQQVLALAHDFPKLWQDPRTPDRERKRMVRLMIEDVTLIKGDLRAILRARRLSQATMRNIRQNLFFAFIYNAIGVPVAAGVLYPLLGILLSPMIAAAAMSFSSVSVIANSLRLRNLAL